MVVGGGWLWLVVVGCGWVGLVVVGSGWWWLVVLNGGRWWFLVIDSGNSFKKSLAKNLIISRNVRDLEVLKSHRPCVFVREML